MMSIIIAIIIFGVIVLVHEWGHFISARMNGILVEEFAIGMGPKLFGIQKGDTLYSIRALPIGGYCKMLGEDESDDDPRSFNNKRIDKRIIVIVAGAFMNFLLAFLVFTAIAYSIGFSSVVVSEVAEGSPAETSGLLPGDKILKINNKKINLFEQISLYMNNNGGNTVNVQFRRGNDISETTVTPAFDDGAYRIGVIPVRLSGFANNSEFYDTVNIFEAFANGFWKVIFWISLTFNGIIGLITSTISIDQMAGPIGVVSYIGEIYNETIQVSVADVFINMANFAALLSVNIGAFNLLPIPALDGGRLVFLIIEAIRRKPITAEIEGRIHFAGFVLLMGFALFIAFKDVIKLM